MARSKTKKWSHVDDGNLMLLAALAAILVGAFGILLYRQKLTAEMMKPKVMTVTMSAQNGSKENGTATLTEVNGKTTVSLNITGAPKGVAQPAHIHIGKCPTPGAVKYPLTSPVDGKSETTLNVTLDELKAQQPLALNVHKSATQSGVYVSCGNLTF